MARRSPATRWVPLGRREPRRPPHHRRRPAQRAAGSPGSPGWQFVGQLHFRVLRWLEARQLDDGAATTAAVVFARRPGGWLGSGHGLGHGFRLRGLFRRFLGWFLGVGSLRRFPRVFLARIGLLLTRHRSPRLAVAEATVRPMPGFRRLLVVAAVQAERATNGIAQRVVGASVVRVPVARSWVGERNRACQHQPPTAQMPRGMPTRRHAHAKPLGHHLSTHCPHKD